MSTYEKMKHSPFALGVLKGAVGMPIEHPLDLIKTRMQVTNVDVAPGGRVKPRDTLRSGVLSEVSSTFRAFGLRGFYHGVTFGATRMLLKNVYRTTVYLHITRALTGYLGEDQAVANALVTAPIMAASEALFLTAPERLKIWVITARKQQGVMSHLRSVNGGGAFFVMKELYRGVGVAFVKGLGAWVIWDVASKYSRQKYRSYLEDSTRPLTLGEQFALGIGTSIVTVALVQPVDFVKTQMQRFNSKNVTMRQVFGNTIKVYGPRMLYIGSAVNIVKYTLHDTMIGVFREFTKDKE